MSVFSVKKESHQSFNVNLDVYAITYYRLDMANENNEFLDPSDSEQHKESSAESEDFERPSLSNDESSTSSKIKIENLDSILDIPLKVSVELGRSIISIKDLLQMDKGSVIELEKLAGEPLEILVNNKEVAKGEVVVINEKFGIRLTDIIDPIEKVQ